MKAILKGGPVDGEIRDVDARAPHHIDVEVDDGTDLAPSQKAASIQR